MATQTSQSFGSRFERYQPSKSVLAWACIGAAILTIIVGFSWGGWVTGGTSRAAVASAADTARGDLASAICVERFYLAPDAAVKLVEFKALTDSSKKRQFVEAGGWATMPGQTAPDKLGVQGCVTALAV
jgi:hypothetical protein